MNIKTETFMNHPRAVATLADGTRVTAIIRPGETPRQALQRLADHWAKEAKHATETAARYAQALV